MISVTEKYSSTLTVFGKLRRAFKTHSDPVVSDICCYSQPCFDEATKLFRKLGEGGSTDHGSLPVAKYKIFITSQILCESWWFTWPIIWPGHKHSYMYLGTDKISFSASNAGL